MLILNEAAAEGEEALQGAWRRWLQVFNLMQFLPGQLLATAAGLDGDDYAGLAEAVADTVSTPAQAADQAALNGSWLQVLEQALSPLQPGLKQLAQAGATTPVVGYDLTDAKGRIQAEAELAWSSVWLAVLRPDQEDLAPTWRANGWHPLLLDEGLNLVAGRPWTLAVAERLGLHLSPEA
jgi:DEAD/DEAH box helicase domain-containing protein